MRGEVSVFGVDHAWGRPSIAALKAAKVLFVCRYLSHDTTGKNLTRAEAQKLTDAGLWIVVVWETTADRALSGRAGGVADAQAAAAQAKACGMPADRPIYFAVDWDASTAQQGTIDGYLDGAASVIGRERVGIYGGYGPVQRAMDGGHAAWGWQTYAWSGGRWHGPAQLQQYSNDHVIGGVGLDYDRGVHDDYGQWMIGESPMALSAADLESIRKIVWEADKALAPTGSDPKNPTWQPINIARDTYSSLQQVKATVAKLATLSPDVDEAAIVQGVLAGLTPEAIAVAVVGALPADLAQQVVDAIAARLGDA
jgi:hypothetical protein